MVQLHNDVISYSSTTSFTCYPQVQAVATLPLVPAGCDSSRNRTLHSSYQDRLVPFFIPYPGFQVCQIGDIMLMQGYERSDGLMGIDVSDESPEQRISENSNLHFLKPHNSNCVYFTTRAYKPNPNPGPVTRYRRFCAV